MIQPAPFAAKIEFKAGHLYQKKHSTWTFRSDAFAANNAPADQHFRVLQDLITKDFNGQFVLASIFDNRLKPYAAGKSGGNNLVFQVSYNRIWIDRRKELDFAFLEPTFDADFIHYMAQSFADTCPYDPLAAAVRVYKQNITQ